MLRDGLPSLEIEHDPVRAARRPGNSTVRMAEDT
jgi:hypothetical protein